MCILCWPEFQAACSTHKAAPVLPFGNAQEYLHALLFLRLARPNHELFTQLPLLLAFLLFTLFFNCFSYPWNPSQSYACTLLKCVLHCCFYEHQLLCGSEPSLLTQKGGVPCSSDTWEGAGTFSPNCRSTGGRARHILKYISVWVYKKPVQIIHRPYANTQRSTNSMCAAALRSCPGLTLVIQRASQRPVTSGCRNSTCELGCWPPAVACFLFLVHIQPLNSYNPDCPEATFPGFSKYIKIWTNPDMS